MKLTFIFIHLNRIIKFFIPKFIPIKYKIKNFMIFGLYIDIITKK